MSKLSIEKYFPGAKPLTAEQRKKVEAIDQDKWDEICSKCGSCCHDYGAHEDDSKQCIHLFNNGLCNVHDYIPEYYNCFDVKRAMIDGTFKYTAPWRCSYWKVWEEITNTEVI